MSVCIVIHGTWGERSDFAFSDSLFCRVIKEAYGKELEFRRFEWSGKNSAVERARAVVSLQELIRSLGKDNPSIFLLAHSHGGNVALDALLDPSIATTVSGIVTLGTPFLERYVQPWVKSLDSTYFVICCAVTIMGMMGVGIVFVVGSYIGLLSPIYGAIGGLTAITIFYRIALNTVKATPTVLEEISSIAYKMMPKNRHPIAAKVLVIYTKSDEAFWWLRTVFSMANLPFAVLNATIILAGWLWILGMWAGVVFLLANELVGRFLERQFPGVSNWLQDAATLSLVAPHAILVLCMILFVFAAVVAKPTLRMLGTGAENRFGAGVLTNQKATRVPARKVKQLEEMQVKLEAFHGGLWHSKYMRSGEVADRISQTFAKWT